MTATDDSRNKQGRAGGGAAALRPGGERRQNKEARLARALRANLARRKAQSRARAQDKDNKGGEGKS
ncbi:MAG: hypothetical protein EXR04_06480 [Rhodospirillales bacterium]|nr:hypothetical protein [Rhodospirillales bacterium]